MILVTGANGFIGSAMAMRLIREHPGRVRGATRRPMVTPLPGLEMVTNGALEHATDWGAALSGVTAVVHLAARVHVMREGVADPLTEFRRVNVDGSLALARQAAAAGVRRLVFVSSIKVNGESTSTEQPFLASDEPRPVDPYAISKLEAEQGLLDLGRATGLEIVIVRPPLVYGPGVKANFFSMMKWLQRGVPLPFGAIHNRRSLVAVDNLVDLLARCVHHPAAAGRTFLVSDGEDLSTTELLRRLGAAFGKPARLLPVPERMLVGVAQLLGGATLAQRLCESLRVDIHETRRVLEWSPPVTVEEGLRRTVEAFRREASV